MKEILIYIHEKDVTTVYKKIQTLIPFLRWKTISIGNCGWLSPDYWWYVYVPMRNDEWKRFATWLNESEIDICNDSSIL